MVINQSEGLVFTIIAGGLVWIMGSEGITFLGLIIIFYTFYFCLQLSLDALDTIRIVLYHVFVLLFTIALMRRVHDPQNPLQFSIIDLIKGACDP